MISIADCIGWNARLSLNLLLAMMDCLKQNLLKEKTQLHKGESKLRFWSAKKLNIISLLYTYDKITVILNTILVQMM